MHKRLVFYIIARIVFLACLFLLLPLAWAVYDNPYSVETNAFVVTILITLLVACIGGGTFRVTERSFGVMNAKDGLAVVGLTWIVLSGLGALPLMLSGAVPGLTDAYFEIASGFSTTGASILTNIEALPRGILFWRSLTHWLGGMGIVVLFVALLPSLGYNAFHLYRAEAPGMTAERILPNIKETAKLLWEVYFLLSVSETFLLMHSGMNFFDALCHTFGTMATGGFSTKNASIAAFGPATQWIITVFMFFAGMNFLWHIQVLRGKWRSPFKDEEFRMYAGLMIVFSVLVSATLFATATTQAPIRHGFFQVFSIMTTTGYATADFDLWPNALRFGLVMMMFIGGCGGSTGGGMKVSRICLSVKVALRSVRQTLFPNMVAPVRFNGRTLSRPLVVGLMSFFALYILLFFGGTIGLLITEQCDIVTALTASVATLSNIGPGLGKIGATQHYAWMSVYGKWLCVFLMLAGRLELYAILILFVPSAWKK